MPYGTRKSPPTLLAQGLVRVKAVRRPVSELLLTEAMCCGAAKCRETQKRTPAPSQMPSNRKVRQISVAHGYQILSQVVRFLLRQSTLKSIAHSAIYHCDQRQVCPRHVSEHGIACA